MLRFVGVTVPRIRMIRKLTYMKPHFLIAAAVALVVSTPALANVQYNFYADGVTESYAQQGRAVFDFSNDGSSLSITLTDLVAPTAAVLSSITGIEFSLSSTPSSATLTSATATQVIDCTNASSPCPPGSGSSPYGWGATQDAGSIALGAGFDGGSFSYQPYGIVNASYATTGDLGNAASNPLLVGPVTFNFTLTGLRFAPEVSSVVFKFGDPTPQDGAPIPEPQSLALLALGLLTAGFVTRRTRA